MTPPTIVLLGATGDLSRKLLFPALHRLAASGELPEGTRVMGYADEPLGTEAFLASVHDALARRGSVDPHVWERLRAHTTYTSGVLDAASLRSLADAVRGPAVCYLALPPGLFADAATALGAAGFADESHGYRRLVVEKPFGTSVASAAALQAALAQHWHEHQLYRMDHFLARETVEKLLVFRGANRFVDALWSAEHIAQVQITAAETIGLEGRWRYYDTAGALRDMLQNHLLQLFALCAMEPPTAGRPDALRDAKAEVLASVRDVAPHQVASCGVRGRYTAGTIGDEPVRGYLEEPHIPASSRAETYAAIMLHVDSDRWRGVPFRLRSGKRLPATAFEIALQLRAPQQLPFTGATSGTLLPTPDHGGWIVYRMWPDQCIVFEGTGRASGLAPGAEPLLLRSGSQPMRDAHHSAYAQLLIDVLAGDQSHFVRDDEVAHAWRIVQPVLDVWEAGGDPLPYSAGSDGPAPPDGFFADGDAGTGGWRPILP